MRDFAEWYGGAVLDTLGWILCLQGNLDNAVEHLKRAKDYLRAVPTVRYHLGMAYFKRGEMEEAQKELQEALTISSTFPEADSARQLLEQLKGETK